MIKYQVRIASKQNPDVSSLFHDKFLKNCLDPSKKKIQNYLLINNNLHTNNIISINFIFKKPG